jgi:hypothetical protein
VPRPQAPAWVGVLRGGAEQARCPVLADEPAAGARWTTSAAEAPRRGEEVWIRTVTPWGAPPPARELASVGEAGRAGEAPGPRVLAPGQRPLWAPAGPQRSAGARAVPA